MILKFHKRRILFFFFVVMVVYAALLVKMYSVQIVHRADWRAMLERVEVRTRKVWRKRGTIFDASGNPLAFSYTTWSLAADPQIIAKEGGNAGTLAAQLSAILGLDRAARATLEAKLSMPERRFEWIARRLEPSVAAQVRSLKNKGLILEPEYKRFYTNPKLLPQVLGLVGMDDRGLAGVEFSYDDQLSGVAGQTINFAGLRGIEIPRANLIVNQPKGGHHLYLTIDSGIQRICDAACERLMALQKPSNCFVLVVDPMTGEIIACAMRPTFDESDFAEYTKNVNASKNLPISHIFEPGSTFKIVTMSAGIEEEKVTPTTPFHCPGYLSLYGFKIGCTSVHGDLTASEVIEHSCNVGAMSIGIVLGPRTLYYYLKKFGFGEKTGVELPGEANGIVRLPKDWSGLSVAAIAMGQEIGVTGLQMAMAASAVVNGGKLLKPTIIKKVTTYDNRKVLYRAHPTVRHQVISPETADKVKTMMHAVVLRGTGRRAASDFYTAGGKTGTSQKLGKKSRALKESGERDKANEKVVTSFVGFFPYERPQYLIYIMANEPQAYRAAGGTVAAPVFREIATQIVWYKGMVPDVVLSSPELLPVGASKLTTEGPGEKGKQLASKPKASSESKEPSAHARKPEREEAEEEEADESDSEEPSSMSDSDEEPASPFRSLRSDEHVEDHVPGDDTPAMEEAVPSDDDIPRE